MEVKHGSKTIEKRWEENKRTREEGRQRGEAICNLICCHLRCNGLFSSFLCRCLPTFLFSFLFLIRLLQDFHFKAHIILHSLFVFNTGLNDYEISQSKNLPLCSYTHIHMHTQISPWAALSHCQAHTYNFLPNHMELSGDEHDVVT